MKAILSLLFALVIVGALARAPLLTVPSEKVVKSSYLVILHDNVTANIKESHMSKYTAVHGIEIRNVWTIINGYAAFIASDEALEAILEDPLVNYVEQDQIMSVEYKQENHVDPHHFSTPDTTDAADSVSTQNLGSSATGLWGLSRVWQKTPWTDKSTFKYWTSAGAGVDVFIVDTGINPNHVEFTGRFDATCSTSFVSTESTYVDGNGHGTHVASTSAGTTYGLAKKATICAVKVLSASGSGTNAGVISGIDYVAARYRARGKKTVGNMSLGGGASTATDNAVNNAVAAGVVFAVAAGNENQNACNVSPARAANAWTVGSTTNTDARSSFSNYGNCVKIFAPGSNILGAWYNSNTATNTISGTSMASPHACGAVALHLGHTDARPTPQTVMTQLQNEATLNAISGPGTGSPNRLLFTSTTD